MDKRRVHNRCFYLCPVCNASKVGGLYEICDHEIFKTDVYCRKKSCRKLVLASMKRVFLFFMLKKSFLSRRTTDVKSNFITYTYKHNILDFVRFLLKSIFYQIHILLIRKFPSVKLLASNRISLF